MSYSEYSSGNTKSYFNGYNRFAINLTADPIPSKGIKKLEDISGIPCEFYGRQVVLFFRDNHNHLFVRVSWIDIVHGKVYCDCDLIGKPKISLVAYSGDVQALLLE